MQKKIAIQISSVILMLACSSESGFTGESQSSATQQPLWAAQGRGIWGSRVMEVCFTHDTYVNATYTTLRSNIHDWVQWEFGSRIDMQFTGWGDCGSRGQDKYLVKVTLGSSGNVTNSVYNPAESYYAGMSLRGDATEGTVLHEFMHALGFPHEYERAGGCTGSGSGETPRVSYTDFDPDAVTDRVYCNDVQHLSRRDVLGLQRAFGPKHLSDFDKNGKDDILWHNRITGMPHVWLMDGIQRLDWQNVTPDFSAILKEDSGWQMIGTGDFNADGAVDIFWHNRITGVPHVWFMNGTQRMAGWDLSPDLSAVLKEDGGWRAVGVADFNLDGRPDILWHNLITGVVQVWHMNGLQRINGQDVTPDLSSHLKEASGWRVVGTGDFNADGMTDILWHNLTTGITHVWLMDGVHRLDGLNTWPDYSDVTKGSSGWRVAGVGHFAPVTKTGDIYNTSPDILWHNIQSGVAHVWYMDGLQRLDGVDTWPDLRSELGPASGWKMTRTSY